jgi:hypothetical protein
LDDDDDDDDDDDPSDDVVLALELLLEQYERRSDSNSDISLSEKEFSKFFSFDRIDNKLEV